MGAAGKLVPFEIFKESDYILIKFRGALESEAATEFDAKVEDIKSSSMDVVLNCEQLSGMDTAWIRSLMQLQKNLKSINKQMRMIVVNATILKLLRTQGVNTSLKICDNLRAALVDMGVLSSTKALDVNFINPFLTATIAVLEIQASTKATSGKIYRRESNEKFLGDISGVIGLISEAFSGSVVISFPGPTFLKIVSRMLGEECTTINKEIEDGAGEITNIIFGQAKITLNNLGFGIKTALPSVVSGADHSILQMTKGPRVVIPFETDVGPFFIEICVSA